MNYQLIKDIIDLSETFEKENVSNIYEADINGFKNWLNKNNSDNTSPNITYEGQELGRSIDSVISTLLVHLGRYAKSYSKAAMVNTVFATQDEFIFLITLKSFGTMTKMDLIKRNVHEKPVGMQIISRLIKNGLVDQINDQVDKRSKLISITEEGLRTLDQHMGEIRKATSIVSGQLSTEEKIQLVQLLTKLDEFHLGIYNLNIGTEKLLNYSFDQLNTKK